MVARMDWTGFTDRRDLTLGGRGREGQGKVFRVFIVETFFPRKGVSGWDRDGKTFSDPIDYDTVSMV